MNFTKKADARVFLYRFLLTLAAPFFAIRLLLRGGIANLSERLASEQGSAHRGAVFWVHAASNGELTAARPLIKALLDRDRGLRIIITCNSDTGKALAQDWKLARVSVRLAPLDYGFAVRRFIANWQPDALILIENELWPNRMVAMQELSRPVIVLSGRMSEKSARVWKKLPSLAREVVGTITYLSAQDRASRDRFIELGVPTAKIGPVLNLKTQGLRGAFDAEEKFHLSQVFPHDRTLLAASTHDGEEKLILRGFKDALAERPDLRLIIAPRHPRRSEELQDILFKFRLTFATRSKGDAPSAETQVYLADTLGEMPLWYELCSMTFVGGSLAPVGGHTPLEPAAHHSMVLHGTNLENFAEIYASFEKAGASRRISGANDLRDILLTLSKEDRDKTVKAADAVLDKLKDDTTLAPLLDRMAKLTSDANLRR
ncbi:3-deoxy-D-manno-octulosonic acid transferase [Actibacterium lipolyticum]|uniref:3-deoxy-D-manno-octulosonic acid transferase n=1 Tax=Actibacterium lipolyticum TaxID=1524263 RepID=A0A238KM40_9RHOB|nr:glycosyltransferase N-terminal domain-containing protein [Actibacterium lipolyticum]SMX43833.1 3-deoxy-D-manno-octulosonic acid transferase [Actibacterium lipolyticum]